MEEQVGYLKYSGALIEDGLLDMRKSAEALLGFDGILRHFLIEIDPKFEEGEFDIPVRIRKGSWEAVIVVAGVVGTTYLVGTVTKAAQDGIMTTGLAKDIKKALKLAIKAAQWTIRIASHIGSVKKRKFEHGKINNEGVEPLIEIYNDKKEIIVVPKKYIDLYLTCPEKLFSKNAGLIEKERILEIGIYQGKNVIEKVSITEKEKGLFYSKDDELEIFLPELKHGQNVQLEGEIIRATENTNSLGFAYEGHTIICKPDSGTIARFKNSIVSRKEDHLFPKVRIVGVVDRTDSLGGFKAKRPEIHFSNIIPLEPENKQMAFF